MDRNQFIKEFAAAIDRRDPIKMEDDFRMYDEWCSIGYLSTLALVNEYARTQVDEMEFESLRTVQDLYNRINK